MGKSGLRYGELGTRSLHVCVDMQRLFGPCSPWHVPWMDEIIPHVERLAAEHPAKTVFTRFIPARAPLGAPGMWRRFYTRWSDLTLEKMDGELVALVPELKRLVPPASVLDKRFYSPWTEGQLDSLLTGRPIDTLVITGLETDVCVLATVLGSIDRGYRTVVVSDAICSSVDATHEALMGLFVSRFSEQLELATTLEVLDAWS